MDVLGLYLLRLILTFGIYELFYNVLREFNLLLAKTFLLNFKGY